MGVKYKKGKKETKLNEVVHAQLGEKFEIKKDNILAELTPSEFSPLGEMGKDSDKMVMFHTKFFDISGGKRSLIAKPQIVAIVGQKSTFSVGLEEAKVVVEIEAKKSK